MYQRLAQKGITCYSAPQVVELPGYGGTRAVVCEDPDGQMIELIQPPSAEEIPVRATWAERNKAREVERFLFLFGTVVYGQRG